MNGMTNKTVDEATILSPVNVYGVSRALLKFLQGLSVWVKTKESCAGFCPAVIGFLLFIVGDNLNKAVSLEVLNLKTSFQVISSVISIWMPLRLGIFFKFMVKPVRTLLKIKTSHIQEMCNYIKVNKGNPRQMIRLESICLFHCL